MKKNITSVKYAGGSSEVQYLDGLIDAGATGCSRASSLVKIAPGHLCF